MLENMVDGGDRGMSEYKFRGKRIDNGEWIEGCLLTLPNGNAYIVNGSITFNGGYLPGTIIEVDPATVGQDTSRKDKNGKEGYRSDIIKTRVGLATIEFGEYTGIDGKGKHIGFYVRFVDEHDRDIYRDDLGWWLPESEIIGNIHDNPLEVAL